MRAERLELSTNSLKSYCSAIELHPRRKAPRVAVISLLLPIYGGINVQLYFFKLVVYFSALIIVDK